PCPTLRQACATAAGIASKSALVESPASTAVVIPRLWRRSAVISAGGRVVPARKAALLVGCESRLGGVHARPQLAPRVEKVLVDRIAVAGELERDHVDR